MWVLIAVASLKPHWLNRLAADLYITIYNSVRNPSTGHGREGYYFAENGEYSQYEVAKAISEAMFEFGKGAALEPTTFTADELKHTPEVKTNSFSYISKMIWLFFLSLLSEAHLLQCHELSLSCRPFPRNRMETNQNNERYAGEHEGRSRRFDKQFFF